MSTSRMASGNLYVSRWLGICASDLKYLQDGSTQIAGHEFAGVLEDGTAVAVEGFFGRGECEQCEQGTYNMCVNGTDRARDAESGRHERVVPGSEPCARAAAARASTSPTRRSWSRQAWRGTAATRVRSAR